MTKVGAPVLQHQMTLRQLLALAALALPFSGELLAAQASPKPRKKGLCLSAKTRSPERVAQFLKAVNSR